MKQQAKIMIVEDELIVSKNIESQLEKLGYHVTEGTGSGSEAVTLAGKLKPDLVLMDIKLEGPMNGLEAAQQIHDRYRIPVVYLTAYADDDTLERAKITDPYGYILKPFESKKIHTTIEIALYKHKMEEKLRKSEIRFRTLAESSPVGIFQTDLGGQCSYVNHCWSSIAGLSQEEAPGRNWMEFLYPGDRDMVATAWEKTTRLDEPFALEFRFQPPGGKESWVFAHVAPLSDEGGTKTGYIGTLTDITARKKLEDELITSQKLESIGILAGGIAHDFNNLLSVIVGNISLLKVESNINDDQFRMLSSMEKASAQAAELAQKLITFSRGGWLEHKKVACRHLIREVIKQNFPLLEEDFTLDIPVGVFPINGDYNKLKQVFTNLLLNAVEAGGGERDITIRAENIDRPEEDLPLAPGGYVRITVEDRGTGIPEDNLGRIYDPYFTTRPKSSRRGLGLGLTICYSIIQKHDGYIHVSSTQGKGTIVEVYLPIFRGEEPDQPIVENGMGAGEGKAMVVDDDHVIQDVTRKMLERLGYEVEYFDEGNRAVEAFIRARDEGDPFDIVFLDLINKKGLGGQATLKKLLKLDPNIRAFAMSGFSNDSDWPLLEKEGFKDILFKPFKWNDLRKILNAE